MSLKLAFVMVSTLLLTSNPCLFHSQVYADENSQGVSQDSRWALGIELLGRAGAYSLNLDYLIIPHLALGVGGSFLPESESSGIIVPIYLNFYPSTKPHRLLLSVGVNKAESFTAGHGEVFLFSQNDATLVFGVGYEYRAPGGFLFRISPYFFAGDSIVLPWIGFTFGLTF